MSSAIVCRPAPERGESSSSTSSPLCSSRFACWRSFTAGPMWSICTIRRICSFGLGGLARALGRVVIFDHHDLAPELFEEKFGSGWPALILRWCERLTMRVAHVVIAANESHRRVAIQRGHVDRKRVVVVRNAPRENTIATAPLTREGTLGSPRLCYVGSLGSQDGVRILPEILARLCRSGLEPVLDLVGDGPELATIRRLAQEHHVLERIQFIGQVPHDQVPQIIAAADICLDVAPCTPLNHQSTMIKIGEYLAAGRPIVSFALEETRSTAGDCALYAASADLDDFCGVIMRLCADEGIRAALSARALERARETTWERSAERLRYAYALASDRLRGGESIGHGTRSTFVSWTPHPRADAIADALGATVYCPSPGSSNWPAPLRYAIQSARHSQARPSHAPERHPVHQSTGRCGHRGGTARARKRSARLVCNRPSLLKTHKELGTVAEAFRLNHRAKFEAIMKGCDGPAAIGHVRYATCGGDDRSYAQPFEREHGRKAKWFAFAFNGQLANYQELKQRAARHRATTTSSATPTPRSSCTR